MQIGVSNPNVPIFPPRVCTLVLFIYTCNDNGDNDDYNNYYTYKGKNGLFFKTFSRSITDFKSKIYKNLYCLIDITIYLMTNKHVGVYNSENTLYS